MPNVFDATPQNADQAFNNLCVRSRLVTDRLAARTEVAAPLVNANVVTATDSVTTGTVNASTVDASVVNTDSLVINGTPFSDCCAQQVTEVSTPAEFSAAVAALVPGSSVNQTIKFAPGTYDFSAQPGIVPQISGRLELVGDEREVAGIGMVTGGAYLDSLGFFGVRAVGSTGFPMGVASVATTTNSLTVTMSALPAFAAAGAAFIGQPDYGAQGIVAGDQLRLYFGNDAKGSSPYTAVGMSDVYTVASVSGSTITLTSALPAEVQNVTMALGTGFVIHPNVTIANNFFGWTQQQFGSSQVLKGFYFAYRNNDLMSPSPTGALLNAFVLDDALIENNLFEGGVQYFSTFIGSLNGNTYLDGVIGGPACQMIVLQGNVWETSKDGAGTYTSKYHTETNPKGLWIVVNYCHCEVGYISRNGGANCINNSRFLCCEVGADLGSQSFANIQGIVADTCNTGIKISDGSFMAADPLPFAGKRGLGQSFGQGDYRPYVIRNGVGIEVDHASANLNSSTVLSLSAPGSYSTNAGGMFWSVGASTQSSNTVDLRFSGAGDRSLLAAPQDDGANSAAYVVGTLDADGNYVKYL